MIDKITTLDGIEKIDPFFAEIAKFEEEERESKEKIIGESANRTLNKKWNVKLQFGTKFFNELFKFLSEIGDDTILRLTKRGVKIYILNSNNTNLVYTLIDRTEMSQYINTDDKEENKNPSMLLTDTEGEIIIYVEFDILKEMELNEKYPTDVYFDTKEENKMYIVNGKTIESKRLKSIDNIDPTLGTYESNYNNLMKWLKDEESFIMSIIPTSFVNTAKILERKKGKKDKSLTKVLNIEFRKNKIDFIIKDEIKATSVQMYDNDIATPGTRDVNLMMNLDIVTNLAKVTFKNNVVLHINEKLPLIMETKFGAGKIYMYYIMALRSETEEQTKEQTKEQTEEQYEEQSNSEE